MTLILTCKRCRGRGVVPNEYHTVCQSHKSEELKRHFRMHAVAGDLEDGELDSPLEVECNEPPMVTCPQCSGHGIIEFDEEEWDFRVEPDIDDEDGE